MTICDRCGRTAVGHVQKIEVWLKGQNCAWKDIGKPQVDLCDRCLDDLNIIVGQFLVDKKPIYKTGIV